MSDQVAVLLLDFGGPTSLDQVRPYLQRLMSDPAILPLPALLRPLVARQVAARRASSSAERYRLIGGRSPIHEQVQEQVRQLQQCLGPSYAVRHAFRHSPPFVEDVARQLSGEGLRRVVGLPLFPQRSWTTTGSCLQALDAALKQEGLELAAAPSFPEGEGFVDALAAFVLPLLSSDSYVLMVAHGLPRRSARMGDPYPGEVRATAQALGKRLPPGTEWSLAYQSRIGPVEWLRPYLEDEIPRLLKEGVRSLVVAPISFACENLETRYDLDLEARQLAESRGCLAYHRALTPGCHPRFLEQLATLARGAAQNAGWTK